MIYRVYVVLTMNWLCNVVVCLCGYNSFNSAISISFDNLSYLYCSSISSYIYIFFSFFTEFMFIVIDNIDVFTEFSYVQIVFFREKK